MLTAVIFIAILSVLILVHEFGHFIMARRVGVRVETFSLGFGPKLLSRKGKDTEYVLCAIPFGGYVKLAGDNLEEYKGASHEYFSKSPAKRFGIVFCGPLLNYAMGFMCFWFIFVAGYPKLTTAVGGLIDGLGAKAAGIEAGDRIVAVDGTRVEYWEDLQRLIQAKNAASPLEVSVTRNHKTLVLSVPVQEKSVTDILGKKHTVGLIGIIPADDTVTVKHGPLAAFSLAWQRVWELTDLTYEAIWRMVTGQMSMRESVTGPLGMFYITHKVASLGIIAIIHFMATISISLCIFNLLPIPALDGGHLLLLAIEKIRGKGLSAKAERVLSQIGFSFIIALALAVTYNDIVRIWGDKIAKMLR